MTEERFPGSLRRFSQALQPGSEASATKLRDNAQRFFFVVDAQYILKGQGLKIQLVRGVIVCGNRFRITVDNDRLKAQFFQRQRCVNTAVVKLNTLSDTV